MTVVPSRHLVHRLGREPRHPRAPATLVIRARAGRKLTNHQRLFNRLAKRVATLERKAAGGRERLERLLRLFYEKVAPVEELLARRQIELAHALADAHGRLPLRNRQKDELRLLLLGLRDQAGAIVRLDDDAVHLFEEWSRTVRCEGAREERADLKDHLAKKFRSEYGFQADLPDEDDTPEGFARFRRALDEEICRAEEARAGSEPRMSPRVRALIEKHRQRAAAIRKTLREIYLSLAKVLHPDAVADPAERALREQFMKQAIVAHRQGDVATLLHLELRWGNRHEAGLGALSDDALAVFIPALQEQITRLEGDVDGRIFDPRFGPIAPIAELSERAAVAGLEDRASYLRTEAKAVARLMARVKTCTTERALAAMVRESLYSARFDPDIPC